MPSQVAELLLVAADEAADHRVGFAARTISAAITVARERTIAFAPSGVTPRRCISSWYSFQ